MRHLRRAGKLPLTCLLTLVFLAASLTPRLTPRAYAGDESAPPLPLPEDPLGQQPEQQTPEISVDVDVRDGHPTVRVVDLWGPGRTPFVVRSYTNTQATSTTSIKLSLPGGLTARGWQLNHFSECAIQANQNPQPPQGDPPRTPPGAPNDPHTVTDTHHGRNYRDKHGHHHS
jgi:hypothetical protein